MPTKNEEKKKIKEIKIGDKVTVSETVTVIKIRGEAVKELDKLPQDIKQEVLDEALELSKNTTHPFEVTLEEVKEAKKKKGVQ